MAIIRRKKTDAPFVITAKIGAEDPRLSWQAKGLLWYLLTLPDDWEIHTRELLNHTTDRRRTTANALKELIKFGYLIRQKERSDDGQFVGMKYDVIETGIHPMASRSAASRNSAHTKEEQKTKETLKVAARAASHRELVPEDQTESSIERLCRVFGSWTASKDLHLGNEGSTKKGWLPRTLRRWKRPLEDLLEQVGSIKTIERTMQWYFDHYGEEFVPTAQTMNAFCRKYVKFTNAMNRNGSSHRSIKPKATAPKRKFVNGYWEEVDED